MPVQRSFSLSVLAAIALAVLPPGSPSIFAAQLLLPNGDRLSGEIVERTGERRPIDAASLRAAPETALRMLSVAVPLLAGALLAAKEL